MATTFINAVNNVLVESNEVALTPTNFNNTVGIHTFAKNIVNRVYLQICSETTEWPFLIAGPSNLNDPLSGTNVKTTAGGVRWYQLKPDSNTFRTSYAKIDWDTFQITDAETSDPSNPPMYGKLHFTSYDEWNDRWRTEESVDSAHNATYGVPKRVMESPDKRFFGLSPIPDKDYKVFFTAYLRPSKLISATEELIIPDEYLDVLYEGANHLMYKFKEHTAQAQMADQAYHNGIRRMKRELLREEPRHMRDDRIRS